MANRRTTTKSQRQTLSDLIIEIRKRDLRQAKLWPTNRRVGYHYYSRISVPERADSDYELKWVEWSFDPTGRMRLLVETGRKNDEGTMAAALARTLRWYIIGRRGGVRAFNGKEWVAGRSAIHTTWRSN